MTEETTEIEATTHAKRGPSSSQRHLVCPASAALEPGADDDTSIYAAWGTVAHEIAAYILLAFGARKGAELGDAETYVGRTFHTDGFEIECDMEMADCVNDYCAQVAALVDPAEGDFLMVEQEVPIGHITGEEGATGTADVIGVIDDGKELVVIDLKGGQGVLVEALGNSQLRMYGLGALDVIDLIYPDIERVRLVICQPRKHQYDEEHMTADELRKIGEGYMTLYGRCDKAEAELMEKGRIPLSYYTPGEKQCKFCRVKNACPALAAESEGVILEAANIEDFDDLTEPDGLEQVTSSDLSRWMSKVSLIEDWCKAIRTEVFDRLKDGEEVEGFKLVRGRAGARRWVSEERFMEALGKSRVKADLLYSQKLLSPTQMEKTVGKEKPRIWTKLQKVIEQPEGNLSVAPDDDKREAIAPSDNTEAFDELPEDDGGDLIG